MSNHHSIIQDGYSQKDCDCRYCLHYGGIRNKEVVCKAEKCVCAEEKRMAKEKEEKDHGCENQ